MATRTARLRRTDKSTGSNDVKSRGARKMDLPPVLNQEFIDFDVIKGSAFFNTKPSKYDKRLVRQGFYRSILFPFFPKYWTQKNALFYYAGTLVYVVHLIATCIYLWDEVEEPSTMTLFEIWAPYVLLTLTACGYGRVASLLTDPDSNMTLHGDLEACPPAKNATKSVLDTGLLESEGSSQESGDSDSDGGASSSSEDESDVTKRSTPLTSPSSDKECARRPSRSFNEQSFGDHFTRRRVKVVVWKSSIPIKESMTIAELRSNILLTVKATPPRMLYRFAAHVSSVLIALIPWVYRLLNYSTEHNIDIYDPTVLIQHFRLLLTTLLGLPYTALERFVLRQLRIESVVAISCTLATFILASIIFSALADAEVTYHRRFLYTLLYAKCFTALTSSRRSRASHLPHFRLKNVVNIKAWLSLRGGRSWLKRQGRQRAADEIVSTSFLIVLLFLAVMGVQAVSDTLPSTTSLLSTLVHTEVTLWCLLSSFFLLRFMMLGSNINRKYQNTSLLLTEQMNVYLKLLITPHKKEKLLISNNVLKLASKLLKELNSPNKISGLTMNPLLYNITRVVVLSAFSSALSEVFGFKLKLWKMKV
ncbi:homeodomain transcription factor [Thraustotheca clavata]|uniref:Homeodomain transcription factor n=1 Tax=Thraustotheca clavata TaxID=74557 RepID=A0A1W0AAA2_9STRA|nr:homeodomain transcription factor [Thraustotheca clavata]